jgi:ABC-type nitrate/sulfonate/bicarbonate transport system ATPase subunit
MVTADGAPLAREMTGDVAASVRAANVSKRFTAPDGAEVHALDDVSLTLAAGEMVSLVGPSGCGKSTLLRMVAGLDAPDAGELWVGGELIAGPSADRGLVFQDPNLFPWLTVRRNVQSGLVARGAAAGAAARGGRVPRLGRADRVRQFASRTSFPAAWRSGRRWRGR